MTVRVTPLGIRPTVGEYATAPGPTIGVSDCDIVLDDVVEDRRRRTVEGRDLRCLEDVRSRVALGGREEEIDFQVAQERDAERAAGT